ncbi:hypothetical protein ACQ4WX_17695 [Streptomyces lasalocidi]
MASGACRSRSIVGRATLTMKKSIIGSAVPRSRVNRPRGVSAPGGRGGPAVVVGVVRGVVFVVTSPTLRPCPAGYQAVLIQVPAPPGTGVRGRGTLGPMTIAAPEHDTHDIGEQHVRRRELAAFLRSRRERVTPEQVGLPRGPRRRTPACAARRSPSSPRSG